MSKHSKHTILFLAANPLGITELALGEEARAIRLALERSGYRDKFELVTRWAVRPLDLLDELRKVKPTVVHFSGHGGQGLWRSGRRSRRDVVGELGGGDDHQSGLYFQGADGRPQIVSAAALQETFGAAGFSVKMVVLNACYSEVHAEALLEHIDCVVGMEGSIGDDAAQSFAIGFYGGLGEGESVVAAYRHGCVAISLEGLPDIDHPRLKVREGIDAEQMVLASKPAEDYPHVACAAVDANEIAPREGGIDPLQPTNHQSAARAFIGGVVSGRRLTVVATVAVPPPCDICSDVNEIGLHVTRMRGRGHNISTLQLSRNVAMDRRATDEQHQG